jgi:hypothetical protein
MLAQMLPQCTLTFSPDEGHLSVFVNHVQDIWNALVCNGMDLGIPSSHVRRRGVWRGRAKKRWHM